MESLYLLLTSIVIGAIGILLYFYKHLNYWSKKNIPYVSPYHALKQLLSLFIRRPSLPKSNQELYNYFPQAKYFGILSLLKPAIMIRDPELIKEIMVKSFDHFPNHQSFIDEKTDPIFGKNIFALKGERWREIRNTLSPSFTAVKMKFMFDLVSKCSENFVKHFKNHPNEAEALECKDAFTRYTNDVIATAAFGIGVDSLKNKKNEFYERGKDATNFTFLRLIKMMFFLAFPRLMKLLGQKLLPSGTDNFFRTIIKDTLRTREEKKIIRPDMIHLLMEARDKDNGIELSVDDMIAQAFIFFLAGFETTATLMCFLVYELAINQQVQDKLRAEVDSLKEDISYETVNKLAYLDMVISETLRKYPPAVATDRVCVDGFTLPKATPESSELNLENNSQLFIPIYGLHHDPQYFPEPEKFDPERFSAENKDKINPYVYMPFGLGPRKCIGNRFALMEIKLLFVHILKSFVVERTEKTTVPLEFDTKLAMAIKGGCWVRFQERVSFY